MFDIGGNEIITRIFFPTILVKHKLTSGPPPCFMGKSMVPGEDFPKKTKPLTGLDPFFVALQVENLLPEERIPGIFLLASQALQKG